MTDHIDRLLTSAEVAEILGVPLRTLDNWSWKRIGPPFVRIGRHRRYDPAAFKQWIADHTVETNE